MNTTPANTVRCADCGTHQPADAGRLRAHQSGPRACPGSGRPTGPSAFGPVLGHYDLAGVPCSTCGQPARAMTVHRGLHAVWPCGDTFAVPSETATAGREGLAEGHTVDTVVPLPRRPVSPTPVPDRPALTG